MLLFLFFLQSFQQFCYCESLVTNIEHRIMILKSKNKNPKPVVCEAELS